jgi:hypothetical protein
MSTRERWIVYPLVFLTLGIVLRDKFVPQVHSAAIQFEAGEIAAQRIHCAQLQVKELLCDKLDSNQAKSHALFIHGPSDQPVIVAGADVKTGAGVLETYTAKGIPLIRISSSATGGRLITFELEKSPPPPPQQLVDPNKSAKKGPQSKVEDIPKSKRSP